MSKEIVHEYTQNITCPYCGYEDIDSWEVQCWTVVGNAIDNPDLLTEISEDNNELL